MIINFLIIIQVNNGEFAKYINLFFPNRRCYLFDTFEGFSRGDIEIEMKLGNRDFNGSVYAKEGVGPMSRFSTS